MRRPEDYHESIEENCLTLPPKPASLSDRHALFIKAQQEFLLKKKARLNLLREQSELQAQKQSVFRPALNPSKVTAQSRLLEPRAKQSVAEVGPTFRPTINQKSRNMRRVRTVGEDLYEDAKRRQCQPAPPPTPPGRPRINGNSNKLAAERFLKQFHCITQDLGLSPEQPLDYLQLNQLMVALGFVRQQACSATGRMPEERQKLSDLFRRLALENALFLANVCRFCLCVLNVLDQEPCQLHDKPGDWGCFHEGSWRLSKSTGIHLQRQFQLFARNRLSRPSECVQQKTPQFRPQINDNAAELAARHRERVLDKSSLLYQCNLIRNVTIPDSLQLTLPDLLILGKRVSQAQTEYKRFEKEQQDYRESQQVRFKAGKNCCLRLYQQSCRRKGKQRQNQKQKQNYARQEQEQLFRETAKQYLGKGKQQQNKSKAQPESRLKSVSSSSEPQLIVDVDLRENGGVQQIVVMEGDDPQWLAQRFGRRFNLGREQRARLARLLSAELEQVLQRIEEVEQGQGTMRNY